MDQTFIDALRKSLETRSTAELRRALEIGGRPPEELEAMRQLLQERQKKRTQAWFALATAIVMGTLAATGAWWQGLPDGIIFVAGIGAACMGFACWYVPGLFGQG